MNKPSGLTAIQERAWEHFAAGTTAGETARLTGIGRTSVERIYSEIRHPQATGGRRTVKEAQAREREISERLAAEPTCPRCYLRGAHVCTSVTTMAMGRR